MQAPGGRGARGWGKRGSAGFCPAAPRRAPPAQRCPESVWPLGRHGQCTGDPRVLVRREEAGGGGRGAIIPRSPPTPPRDDRAPCHSVSNPSQSWPLRAALLSAPGHFHPPRAQTVALPPPTSTHPPPPAPCEPRALCSRAPERVRVRDGSLSNIDPKIPAPHPACTHRPSIQENVGRAGASTREGGGRQRSLSTLLGVRTAEK